MRLVDSLRSAFSLKIRPVFVIQRDCKPPCYYLEIPSFLATIGLAACVLRFRVQ